MYSLRQWELPDQMRTSRPHAPCIYRRREAVASARSTLEIAHDVDLPRFLQSCEDFERGSSNQVLASHAALRALMRAQERRNPGIAAAKLDNRARQCRLVFAEA